MWFSSLLLKFITNLNIFLIYIYIYNSECELRSLNSCIASNNLNRICILIIKLNLHYTECMVYWKLFMLFAQSYFFLDTLIHMWMSLTLDLNIRLPMPSRMYILNFEIYCLFVFLEACKKLQSHQCAHFWPPCNSVKKITNLINEKHHVIVGWICFCVCPL